MLKIQVLNPIKEQWRWGALLINEAWVIECRYTIMGSTRVCLRGVDDFGYICNWCAGKNLVDAVYLINVMIGYMMEEKIDKAPLCSDPKPYYKDFDFVKTIQPYYLPYVTLQDVLRYSETTKPVSDYENFERIWPGAGTTSG